MLKLNIESFVAQHEMLHSAHNKLPLDKQCRCILCDIYRKHLKEVPDDSDRPESEINGSSESE